MSNANPYDFFAGIAARYLKEQKVNPGDTYDSEGLLVCGKCKKHRQTFVMASDPTPDEPDRKRPVKVTTQCDCDKRRELEEKKAAENKAAMERVNRLKDASLMGERFQRARFENFQITQYNERNLKLCRRYAERFDEMVAKKQSLLFWGNVGTGKSFAAACIANYLLDRGVPVMMTSFVKLLSLIQNGDEKDADIISRLNSAKLVIFDDLGAERNTDYALEKIYNIIDSRYQRELPIIFTTNLTITEMKNETDNRYKRIYDRVFENIYPMQFTGPSWRRKEASRRFEEMEELFKDI